MEKVKLDSINKKENGLEQSKKLEIIHLHCLKYNNN